MIYISHYTKKYIIRCLLVLELAGFMYIYIFGARGIGELMRLRTENNLLVQELQHMNTVYVSLQQEVERWKYDDFAREKMARERLQMVYKDDEVYYLSS